MRSLKLLALASAAAFAASTAHAAPATTWAYSAKTGVGASYEAYVDGAYKAGGKTGAVSKVWFSIADGVLTETMMTGRGACAPVRASDASPRRERFSVR